MQNLPVFIGRNNKREGVSRSFKLGTPSCVSLFTQRHEHMNVEELFFMRNVFGSDEPLWSNLLWVFAMHQPNRHIAVRYS